MPSPSTITLFVKPNGAITGHCPATPSVMNVEPSDLMGRSFTEMLALPSDGLLPNLAAVEHGPDSVAEPPEAHAAISSVTDALETHAHTGEPLYVRLCNTDDILALRVTEQHANQQCVGYVVTLEPRSAPSINGAATNGTHPVDADVSSVPVSKRESRATHTADLLELTSSLTQDLAHGYHREHIFDNLLERLREHLDAESCSILTLGDTEDEPDSEFRYVTDARSDIWDTLPEDASTACLSAIMDEQTVAMVQEIPSPAPNVEVIIERPDLDPCLLVAAPLPTPEGPTGVLLIDHPNPASLRGLTAHLLLAVGSLLSLHQAFQSQIQEIGALTARHKRLFEDGNDIVFELDEDGIIRYVSPAVAHATGYYPAEVMGQHVKSFLVPEDLDEVPRFWQENGDTRHDVRVLDANGDIRHLRVSLRVEALPDGTCVISGSATDVTRQRTAEIALEGERAFVDHAINHLPGLFCLLNHNLRISRWNEQLRQALGVDASQVSACRFTEIFDFQSRPEINDHIRNAFLGETIRFKGHVQTDEEEIPYMFTATPVEIEGDRSVVCIGIDISELHDTQQRLSENFEALRQIHSISVEDDMPTGRKVQHLLQSGREYLNADMSILATVQDDQMRIDQSAGSIAPAEGTTIELSGFCSRVFDSPPYEWPLYESFDGPLDFPFDGPQSLQGTLHTAGIPLRLDGERWGILSFAGQSDAFRRKSHQANEYMKLLGQWIESRMARERAQEAVKQNERRFRDLFSAAPDAYAVLHPETGRVTDCNTAMEDLLGRPRDRIIGHHYRTLQANSIAQGDVDATNWVDWLQHVVESGEWRGYHVPLQTSDDENSPVLVDISARHVDIGTQPSVLAVFRDVTKRKEAEDALLHAVSRNEAFNSELQTLIRVSRGLETHLNSDVVAGRVVTGTRDTLPAATKASLWTIDGDTARLIASDDRAAGCRLHTNDVDEGENSISVEPDGHVEIQLTHGPFSEIYNNLEAPRITHLPMTRHRHPELEHPFFDGAKSLIAAPITTADKVMGVLIATSDVVTSAFQNRHHALLQSIGAQAAVSLNNAQAVEELRAMSQQLLQAQEDERRRVAQELHDETGGLVTALQFKLQEVEMVLDANSEDDPDHLHEAVDLLADVNDLTETLSEVLRQVSRSLRPKILDDIGLSAALPWLVDEFTERTGIEVDFSSEIDPESRFDSLLETAAFRITQEALTNVARYADTQTAQVIVDHDDRFLRIHVIDHGKGFNLAEWQRSETPTLGLLGMTERAERLGGKLDISSEPGEGTRISATLPADAK
ncbi:PAS domain S-box protein [Longibacter salinarum]|nr:PAS domain S-box protein [Longibacter salinarum]